MIRFLSFGAGTQSSVMLMLAIRGEIDRPDYVLWADTGFEPRAVYAHVNWSELQCRKAEIPFYRVKAKYNLREDFEAFESCEKKHWNSRPPLFAIRGQLRRQCTRDVKIVPIESKKKALMGYRTKRRIPDGAACVQIGISTDESRRAAPSRERWIDREYPLIDPLKMSRADCQSWWDDNFPHVNLPRSSCTICPYKTATMWRRMKETAPEDYAEAVAYDERIRLAYQKRTNQAFWLHSSCEPIAEVAKDTAQMTIDLDDEIYCAGGCGI